MAFDESDWVALWAIGLVTGIPYILELYRLTGIMLPYDYYKDKTSRRVEWYSRMMWSEEWYNDMRRRVGWWAPVPWAYLVIWPGHWIVGTAATWYVWSNRSNYESSTWDGILAIQTTISVLAVVWWGLFLRSRSFFRMVAVISAIFCLVVANLGMTIYGSFDGGTPTAPDGVLYIFYATVWILMFIVSWTMFLVHHKKGMEKMNFRATFLYNTSGATTEFPNTGQFVPADGTRVTMAYVPNGAGVRRGEVDEISDDGL